MRVLTEVFGFDPVSQYFAPFGHLDHPLLDFLNVRVIVSRGGSTPEIDLPRVDGGRFGEWRFYRNDEALPRYFLARHSEAVPTADLLDRVTSIEDPRHVILPADEIQAAELSVEGGTRDWPDGQVRILEHEPGRALLDVGGEGERLLATSLPHPEGWAARAGSESLTRLEIHGAFAGFRIPPDASEVTLRFRPPGWRLGWWITLFSLAGWTFLVLRRPDV